MMDGWAAPGSSAGDDSHDSQQDVALARRAVLSRLKRSGRRSSAGKKLEDESVGNWRHYYVMSYQERSRALRALPDSIPRYGYVTILVGQVPRYLAGCGSGARPNLERSIDSCPIWRAPAGSPAASRRSLLASLFSSARHAS
jgi:hypothetical protein